MTADDNTFVDSLAEFLDFGAGVLSLVSLTCSVIWGLIAQDRMLLNTRERIMAQGIHRVSAVASLAFLLVHIGIKLALDHVDFLAALIPFWLVLAGDDFAGDEGQGTAFLIGCGSLAALLMIFVGITGMLRNRFASPAPVAARWRAMHMLAYPAWCFALVHGLYAGREAKPFFVILYSLGLLAVAGALLLRAAPRPFKRQVVERVTAILGPSGQRPPEVDELVKSRSALQGTDETGGQREGSRREGGRREGGRREGGQRDQMRDTGQFPLPGFGGGQGNPPLGDPLVPPQRGAAASADSGPGFAAAYRAVSMTPRAQEPTAPYLTQQQPPLDMQPTQAMPRMDDGSTTGSTRWPAPSPPPVGEAPPSSYDPMQDTFAGQPLGGQSFQGQAYSGQTYQGETYDTGANPVVSETSYGTAESNAPYGTYNPNDTYNSGPATDALSGYDDYNQPGSGEPWNAPSGGFK
ncbi:cytochrome b/b6 domain-containing protein [Streptomyces sp. MNU76]|uniref:ferric reductase-like transmembrane domain-containing protein n=1 Tax=Streptomyces sp. MNU76 TaxID=2560026 RepID=UPI001E39BEA0|nr:cytochrome b/b6 domain-containing protein [Streptomyces sp. MNU76]